MFKEAVCPSPANTVVVFEETCKSVNQFLHRQMFRTQIQVVPPKCQGGSSDSLLGIKTLGDARAVRVDSEPEDAEQSRSKTLNTVRRTDPLV